LLHKVILAAFFVARSPVKSFHVNFEKLETRLRAEQGCPRE
jgi:hypothetical protein